MPPEVKVLFGKEWRQLLGSKMAMATALLLPTLMIVLVPLLQLSATEINIPETPETKFLPPAFEALKKNPKALVSVMFPMFVALGGMIVPSLAASYTVTSERESRTLELLVALPVRLGHVLAAKLLALVVLSCATTSVLLTIDAVVLLSRGVSVGFVASLYLLLYCSIGFSTGSALLVSVLARDFRTANNINGALFAPTILVTMAVTLFLPSPTLAALVLSALFTVAGLVCALFATQATTFERLLR